MTTDLTTTPITEEQTKDIDFCKKTIQGFISKMFEDANKVKVNLSAEVWVSVVYLKIFSAYLEKQNFQTLEEAWRFMNDIKGIIDKVWYVYSYIDNINISISENSNKVS